MADFPQDDERRMGLLCYLFGIVFATFFITAKPYNTSSFIRFHAFQSIFLVGCLATIAVALPHLPRTLQLLASLIFVVFLASWVFLMISAYRGLKVKLPLIGSLAQRCAK